MNNPIKAIIEERNVAERERDSLRGEVARLRGQILKLNFELKELRITCESQEAAITELEARLASQGGSDA